MPPKPSLPSRLYQDEQDLLAMQALLMEARSRTGDWRYPHLGDLTWTVFIVACHLDPQQHIRLWHDGQGKLVAYAILGEDPAFDCQVLPEYEWTGIEAEALAWAEALVGDLRRRDPQRFGGPLVAGARQDNPQRIAFLEQHGFHYSGQFAEVNMIRSLAGPLPAVVVPPGCQVRPLAGTGEAAARAEGERDVWLPWTDGNIGDDDYARLMRLPGYDRQLDLVAVAPDGVLAAFAICWLDPLNHIADFGNVGARLAYRRRGLARAVLLEGLRRLQACGMDRACVSTGVDNTPALRLYESVGFHPINQYLDYVKPA
jgi:mycothiol synthase